MTLQDQLERKLGQAVSFYLDVKFLTGSGAGQPLGILSDPALVVVAKETTPAQPNDTVLCRTSSRCMGGCTRAP